MAEGDPGIVSGTSSSAAALVVSANCSARAAPGVAVAASNSRSVSAITTANDAPGVAAFASNSRQVSAITSDNDASRVRDSSLEFVFFVIYNTF